MKRAVLAGVVIAILVVLAVFVLRQRDDAPGDVDGPDSSGSSAGMEGSPAGAANSGDHVDHRMGSRNVERRFRSGDDDREPPTPDPRDEFARRDQENADGEDPNRPWKDPVNQRVLGDKRWMAEVTPEMEQRIEDHLDRKLDNPEDRRLQNLDRNAAVMAVYRVVNDCVEALRGTNPGAQGRVSIVFDFTTANGEGRVLNPEVSKIWKLNEYPEFSDCIAANSTNLRFEARTEGTSMSVEYPYFFESEE